MFPVLESSWLLSPVSLSGACLRQECVGKTVHLTAGKKQSEEETGMEPVTNLLKPLMFSAPLKIVLPAGAQTVNM